MAPVADQDEKLGWPLLNFLGAICDSYLQDIEDLASDQGPQTGWATILDPDQAPSYALGWLAQLVGVRMNPSLSDADNISLIKEPVGWQRGSPGAIRAAILPYLTGTKSLILTERYTGDAYKVLVNTITGEVPDTAKMQAAALAQKPAGILMTFTAQLGQTYLQLRTAKATYTIAKAAYADYTAMRNG
jgi:hypothetical protein